MHSILFPYTHLFFFVLVGCCFQVEDTGEWAMDKKEQTGRGVVVGIDDGSEVRYGHYCSGCIYATLNSGHLRGGIEGSGGSMLNAQRALLIGSGPSV